MAYLFSGSTDRIELATAVNGVAKTILITFFRTGAGGGGFGRLFERASGAGEGNESLNFRSSGTIEYQLSFDTVITWRILGTGVANTLYRMALRHNGVRTNLPTAFVNGSQATVEIRSAGSGTVLGLPTANIIVGNRAALDRVWAGWIAELAYYTTELDDKALRAYSSGYSPVGFSVPRVAYLPLVRSANDLSRNTTTATGAAPTNAHPSMFYPSRF